MVLMQTAHWERQGVPEMDGAETRRRTSGGAAPRNVLRFHSQRLGLLFDLRQALQLRRANTALLAFRGVEQIEWVGPTVMHRYVAWTVVGSRPGTRPGALTSSLFFVPDAEVTIVAHIAAFFTGNVADFPHARQILL